MPACGKERLEGIMKSEPEIAVQLIHLHGPMKGQIQEFTAPEITIGRNTTCDVMFPKDLSSVSRNHASIVREGNRFRLVDSSTNGTFVNGKQVKEAFLKDGDVLMFSPEGPKVSFLSRISEARAEETAPRPAAVEPPAPRPRQVERPAAPPEDIFTPAEQPARQQPRESEPPRREVPVMKVAAPLIVQYGPTLNSFKELPVNIGQGSGNELIMPHPSIIDRHAQIFFAEGRYWVKDLTGRKTVSINGRAIDLQAPLNANDVLSLSPQGPTLRFLGEGRLAEYDEPVREAAPAPGSDIPEGPQKAGEKKPKGFSLKDIFKR